MPCFVHHLLVALTTLALVLRSRATPIPQRTWNTPCGYQQADSSVTSTASPDGLREALRLLGTEATELTSLAEQTQDAHKNDNINDVNIVHFFDHMEDEFMKDDAMTITAERKQEAKTQRVQTMKTLEAMLYELADYLERTKLEASGELLSRSDDVLQKLYATICKARRVLSALGEEDEVVSRATIVPKSSFSKYRDSVQKDYRAYLVLGDTIAVSEYVSTLAFEMVADL